MTRLKRGDHVRVRPLNKDLWCDGFVALASDTNPSSVMLMGAAFRTAGIGILCGGLPLSVDYEQETVMSLFGDEYELEAAV